MMEDVVIENAKVGKWDALISYDTSYDEDMVTIAYAGHGGAIISAKTEKESKASFIDAMNLAESVRKLLRFNDNFKKAESHIRERRNKGNIT